MLDLATCRKKLQTFIAQVCPGQSPLYDFLCRQLIDDEPLLGLMAESPAEQPGPNLFLAAVHYLLLHGSEHELREFYPTCTAQPRSVERAWPAFRDFCLTRREHILPLLHTRRVQTNEVRRCSYLLPAFSFLHQEDPSLPLAIVEIGTSAGLLLNWDRYAYDYAGCGPFGNRSSPVIIRSEWHGPPRSFAAAPPVIHRVGIDLHPVDVNDPDQALWLQSLLWPDQPERFHLHRAAIDDFRHAPVPLVAGDALVELPTQLEQAPPNSHLCVLHSHTLNQFTDTQRAELTDHLRAASQRRPIHVISAEWIKTPTTELHWTHYDSGASDDQLLARVDHHGRWVEWLAASYSHNPS